MKCFHFAFGGVFPTGSTVARAPEAGDAFVIESEVMVPMRGGMKLATEIYRAAKEGGSGAGSLPVILPRTPCQSA